MTNGAPEVEHPAVANAAAYGEGGVTANGVVARLAGFTILSTTAMPAGVDIVAGHKDFATYASQFSGFGASTFFALAMSHLSASPGLMTTLGTVLGVHPRCCTLLHGFTQVW
ncbi:hypothetical protein [Streptomyces sp. NPDC054854]